MKNSTISIKQKIIDTFNTYVRGKTADISASNQKHDGRGGHWLETQMGIVHNRSNSPDIDGFEMKNSTSTKTTFGDWSADYYIFKDKNIILSRDEFMHIFGKPNVNKDMRYSWSGEPIPKYNKYNKFGQILIISPNEDIIIQYNFLKDCRPHKSGIVPKNLQHDSLILAKWSRSWMKKKLENKFNKLGWFKCQTDKNGIYTNIVFGEPIQWASWLSEIKKGLVFFDSGMHQNNSRNYSHWRANNKYWQEKITSTY
ncbi:MAG: LlaMI family restriction endonuclease [Microgenomates group bacterium]